MGQSLVEILQTSAQDGFLALPLLIMGFLFFFGTLTSNVGLLFLLLGHFIIVPLLGYFTNVDQIPSVIQQKDWTTFSFVIISALTLLPISTKPFVDLVKSTLKTDDESQKKGNYAWIVLLIYVVFIVIAVANGGTLADSFNVARWGDIFGTNAGLEKSAAGDLCSYLPTKEGQSSSPWSNPSLWIIHLVFLTGFLFSNAAAIWNLPAPKLDTAGTREEYESRKLQLEQRITNRKRIVGSIFFMTSFILILFLAIRYWKTQCEGNFVKNFLPMVFCALIGSYWYKYAEEACNLYPPDVIGIVQGLISPDLIDNPIVCVGNE